VVAGRTGISGKKGNLHEIFATGGGNYCWIYIRITIITRSPDDCLAPEKCGKNVFTWNFYDVSDLEKQVLFEDSGIHDEKQCVFQGKSLRSSVDASFRAPSFMPPPPLPGLPRLR
jgi:hypothetical protein